MDDIEAMVTIAAARQRLGGVGGLFTSAGVLVVDEVEVIGFSEALEHVEKIVLARVEAESNQEKERKKLLEAGTDQPATQG